MASYKVDYDICRWCHQNIYRRVYQRDTYRNMGMISAWHHNSSAMTECKDWSHVASPMPELPQARLI